MVDWRAGGKRRAGRNIREEKRFLKGIEQIRESTIQTLFPHTSFDHWNNVEPQLIPYHAGRQKEDQYLFRVFLDKPARLTIRVLLVLVSDCQAISKTIQILGRQCCLGFSIGGHCEKDQRLTLGLFFFQIPFIFFEKLRNKILGKRYVRGRVECWKRWFDK